ncbi:MAG TPA: cellulase family glycosylhydrolase [Polyangiaceae bacterium]|nr:cellulase family glycosylhydrolase [Polyangiaceae bacterium]
MLDWRRLESRSGKGFSLPRWVRWAAFGASALAVGCSSSGGDPGAAESGGAGFGGALPSGGGSAGAVGNGASAGVPNSGGTSNAAGATNSGGSSNTGGASNTGGSSNSGGTFNSGGSSNTGGASNTGGSSNSGGTSNAGGANSGGASAGGTTNTGGSANGTGGTQGGTDVTAAQGYLHTNGSKVVDWQGNEVRLTGLSWFGMETSNYAPHGLWSRSLAAYLDQIKQLGYNSIRVPFCSQMFDAGSTPNSIDQNSNPDLIGLSPLQILDKLVAGAKSRGLKIILDRHRPDSGGQSALWYTSQYSEARWISDWKMLATHFLGNSTVVGCDLHNEPHDSASWGDGNMATDWRAAAERAGNAILAVNPQLLIIVEGVQNVSGTSSWWGGNLRGAGSAPVNLSVKNRVVYSAHDYPSSVSDQTWFHDANYPNNLPAVWHDAWGYLVESNTAPVWVGEFGTKLATDSDTKWLNAMAGYIKSQKLNFAYWCWNPDSGDTGGILQDDWMAVNQNKQSVLAPLLAPQIP